MKDQDQIKALVTESLSQGTRDFRPCAFFDDRLDCIRVIARDCSVLEERINDRLTVLMDNHYPAFGRKKYVGFTIKGARHFCKEHGWDLARSIKIAEVLDALVSTSPEIVVQWFVEIVANPIIQEGKIEQVEIPDGALAA
jgi:hypothetical protein